MEEGGAISAPTATLSPPRTKAQVPQEAGKERTETGKRAETSRMTVSPTATPTKGMEIREHEEEEEGQKAEEEEEEEEEREEEEEEEEMRKEEILL